MRAEETRVGGRWAQRVAAPSGPATDRPDGLVVTEHPPATVKLIEALDQRSLEALARWLAGRQAA